MRDLLLESPESRTTISPFFHIGITVGKNNQITFDQGAINALKIHIEALAKELKQNEDSANIKIWQVTEAVVAEVSENLLADWKKWKAARLQDAFRKLIWWKLKRKEKKEAKEIVKKGLARFSYVLPVEYIDENLASQRFPIDLVLWSSSTVDSIIESLKWKASIIPALAKNKGRPITS